MVGEGGTGICAAYATVDNAVLRGSRFVGPVEMRGARGQVWLHGRRIPAWWLWVRGTGRITGFLFLAAWLAAWMSSDWVGGSLLGHSEDTGDVWTTFKTRPETASWQASKSKLVSGGPVASCVVTDADATLPTRMGVPRVNTDLARQALENSRNSYSRMQVEVPIGPAGKKKQLYLEVPRERYELAMRVLSGTAPPVT